MKKFNVDNIKFIGNPKTNSVIGLTNEGEELVNNIINNKDIVVKNDSEQMLMNAFEKNNFF